jgi:hypothetical protein
MKGMGKEGKNKGIKKGKERVDKTVFTRTRKKMERNYERRNE